MDTYNINIDKDSGCLVIEQNGFYVAVGEKYVELRIPRGDHMEILREQITDDSEIVFTRKVEPIPPTYRSVPCTED